MKNFRTIAQTLLALACAVPLLAEEHAQLQQRNLMQPDAGLEFSYQQALTATANSTNVIDRGAAENLGGGRRPFCYVSFCGVAPGGTNPTLTAALVGADDAAFTVNKITIGSVTPTLVSGTVPDINSEIPIRSHSPKRYFRIEYTVGGTGSPTMTVTAGLVLDEQIRNPNFV